MKNICCAVVLAGIIGLSGCTDAIVGQEGSEVIEDLGGVDWNGRVFDRYRPIIGTDTTFVPTDTTTIISEDTDGYLGF